MTGWTDLPTTEHAMTDVLAEHYPAQGISGSPNHWAYDSKRWFAYCGTSYEDQKGCGWDSYPTTYDDRMEARRAALEHVAHELRHVAAREARAILDQVQEVYDIQCPVRPDADYVPGARAAHLWWQKVLGTYLREMRAHVDAIDGTV